LVAEPGLRERRGELEGRTFAEIEAELPEQARRWRQRDPHAPGGETLVQLRERIAATTHRLAAQHRSSSSCWWRTAACSTCSTAWPRAWTCRRRAPGW
jgi:broad specificity phosphatase PhoE